MRLLITGATGFAGNALLDLLPGRVTWSKLTLLVLPGDPGVPRVLSKGIKALGIREGDVTDPGQVRDAVRGHTHVIHLAGLISYWRRDRQRLARVNQQGVQNVVDACVEHGVERLVHVSSVGAVGHAGDGGLADEETPFNWPDSFSYMTTKRAGQEAVERAVRTRALKAIILNPASLMGPGDPDPGSAHNRLYRSIFSGTLFGCFAGGLAVTDVRDLASILIKALRAGSIGEKYLVVGSNVTYVDVVRAIGGRFQRNVYPLRVPPFLVTAAGGAMELASGITGRRPLLTASYGRLSGWRGYYANGKSARTFDHRYIPFEKTIADGCAYYARTFGAPARAG